jgi:NAD(P)-dependent dehydrogenase (short-subunit alcohol dehydrogenase family)
MIKILRYYLCSQTAFKVIAKSNIRVVKNNMQNKVIIITGASSGIGRATALTFARYGSKVIAVGRNEKELNSLRDQSKEFDSDVKVHLADLKENSQIERLITETADNFGRIDVLVNSAGIIANGSIEDTKLDDWDKMMHINVRSVFYLIQKCVPFLEQTSGNIVSVSSVAGKRSFPNLLSYCVSKSALDQLTRCVALELAPKKIRVNAVNPGVVTTNLHKRGGMTEEEYETFLEKSKNTHPLGRVGEPEEVAALIYFLASEQASWITGATYEIDGGRGQTCAR